MCFSAGLSFLSPSLSLSLSSAPLLPFLLLFVDPLRTASCARDRWRDLWCLHRELGVCWINNRQLVCSLFSSLTLSLALPLPASPCFTAPLPPSRAQSSSSARRICLQCTGSLPPPSSSSPLPLFPSSPHLCRASSFLLPLPPPPLPLHSNTRTA